LNRTVLRLLGAELRPLLRLVRARLLGLDRPRVRLDRPDLRLLRLNGAELRLVWPVVRLYGPDLRLVGPVVWPHGLDLRLIGSIVRLDWPYLGLSGLGLAGAHFGLAGSYLRLTGADWLDLRPVVWFAWTKS